ncbi:MAG: DDE-type integrase/transposase/recombinase [Nitrosomonadales bacterium]|nr:DDE-type integrase/transposase/recombinase [Nitrosomonadales bacterium]
MEDAKEKLRHEVALFRYGVIADLLHLSPGATGLYAQLKAKSEQDHCIPGSLRRRVAQETMRDWLRHYRQGGFDGLMPKPRADAGKSRKLPQEVADLLVTIKEEHRDYSVRLVIEEAFGKHEVSREIELAPSTVHRLLSRHGLMRKESGEPRDKDHRRFSFLKAGDLWMSDVMYGPAVLVDGRRRHRTYLIGFIDDATRVVPYAAFALSENTETFLPVLKGALLRRSIPRRLFVDNGAVYRSNHLELVCARLGITLIHARAYHPQAKGKQERWFRTVRMQFLPRLTPQDTESLDALNRKLWAWVEGEYHHAPHRGLDGETPLDRWARVADEVRCVTPDIDLDDLCLLEARRVVQRDRTISLDGIAYEVDASLVGETVTLRYDSSRRGRPIQVHHKGRLIQQARVVDTYANCFVRRARPSRQLEPVEPVDSEVVATAPEPPQGLLLNTMAERDHGPTASDDKEDA